MIFTLLEFICTSTCQLKGQWAVRRQTKRMHFHRRLVIRKWIEANKFWQQPVVIQFTLIFTEVILPRQPHFSGGTFPPWISSVRNGSSSFLAVFMVAHFTELISSNWLFIWKSNSAGTSLQALGNYEQANQSKSVVIQYAKKTA